MKLRLQIRYSLAVVAILAAVVAMIGVAHLFGSRTMIAASTNVTSQMLTKALHLQVKKQGEGLAAFLAYALAGPITRGQMDIVETLTRASVQQGGTAYVKVLDRDGRVISAMDSRTRPDDGPLTEGSLEAGLDGEAIQSSSDGAILHIAAPIQENGTPVGSVRIGMSLADTKTDIASISGFMNVVRGESQRFFVVLYFLIAVIIIAVGLGFGLLMVRNIVRPIHGLSRYTRLIGAGSYDAPPPFERADELGELAKDLGQMARNLKQMAQFSRLATLGEMAVGVAHELSQPLNTIRLAADNARLVGKGGTADPKFTDSKLELISDQAANMGEMLQRMSVVGRWEGPVEEIDCRESLQDAYSLLSGQYEDEGIRVTLSLPEAPMPAVGRRNELAQVMINLMSNARDSVVEAWSIGGDGGSVIGGRIDISMEEDGDEVVIRVRDNGGGIAPEALERVFDPFFTTKEVTKGTGLGLSISYGIVDAMGGRITAQNDVTGAVFTIRLPKAGIKDSQPAA